MISEELFKNEIVVSIFIMIITVYFTESVINLFRQRRERRNILNLALNSLRQTSYLFKQAAYHRYEAEIFSNYYEAKGSVSPEAKQHHLDLVIKMTDLSSEMYAKYSDIHFEIRRIRQNMTYKQWPMVKGKAESIYRIHFFVLKDPKSLDITTDEQLEQYKREEPEKVKALIESEIISKVEDFANSCESILR